MKLLQEPDCSLYIVIRAEGEGRRLTAIPSEAIILHCVARLAVSVPIMRKVPYCIAVSAFARLCKEELSYCECAMLHCSEEFDCIFAVGEFPYCKGLERHCSKRVGHVFAVSELSGEKVGDTLVMYQDRKGGNVREVTGE
jgi:hypothetical protein